MSVEMANNSVILPHAIDWRTPLQWSRNWQTGVASGLQGQEDRSNLRRSPLHTISFRHLCLSLQEQRLLEARSLEATKRGRAVVPFWGRPIELAADAGRTSCDIASTRWPLAVGDWVFFVTPGYPILNVNHRLDSGGYGVSGSGWFYDQHYTGGSNITTSQPIDRSEVSHPAPEGVYQSAREYLVEWPNRYYAPWPWIIYSITGLVPGLPCRLRVHFTNWPQSGYGNDITITVQGITSQSASGSINTLCGGVDWKAYAFDFVVEPDMDGNVTVTIGTNSSVWNGVVLRRRTFVCGIELHQMAWELRQLTGVSSGTLSWSDPLLGIYSQGQNIYPAFWGKPTIQSMEAVTNWNADCTIKVEEPLPDVELADPTWVGEEEVPVYESGYFTRCQSRSHVDLANDVLGAGRTFGQTIAFVDETLVYGRMWPVKTAAGHSGPIATTAADVHDPNQFDQAVREEWEQDVIADFISWCAANNYEVVNYQIDWQENKYQPSMDYFDAYEWYYNDSPWFRQNILGYFSWLELTYSVRSIA